MDFIDRIRELAARIPKQLEHIQTEEATKNALVMPFIAGLGYNVFDPTELTPELNADVGLKKGEKVDYAILRDGKPIILFECKHHAADLSKVHASQLYRYFSVTEARFAVLTNGLVYWFYTDLEAANKIDARPFFEFNLLDVRDQDVEELKKFSKSAFDLTNILTTGGIRGSFGVGALRCFLLMPLFPSAGAAEAGATPSLRSAHRYTRAHTANR